MANSKRTLFLKRRLRVRNKLRKVNAGRVRLSVHRSNKNISVQLIDDVLDYQADAGQLGKNLGDDLAEGKMTLPLIRTLAEASPAQAEIIRSAITARSGDLAAIATLVRAGGALDFTRDRARDHAKAVMEKPMDERGILAGMPVAIVGRASANRSLSATEKPSGGRPSRIARALPSRATLSSSAGMRARAEATALRWRVRSNPETAPWS